ncbi:MAG: transporter substrate-binding domain-containing protein [Oceanospirillum sp.]|nr:transporter substrate-binding domain-containing protein [Oceanospirillum sp.]
MLTSNRPMVLTNDEQQWLAAHPEVTIAYDGYFPPYSFINDDGELEGFSIDLMRLISQKTGIRFNIHPQHGWKELYQAAQDKDVDMIATLVDREERRQWFDFSNPYIFKSLVVITRSDDTRINRRADIRGKTVAMVKGYQYATQALNDYPSIKPLYVDTILDALNAVSTGKADATITFLSAGHYYRNKYLLTNLKYATVYDKNSSFESFGVRKDWPELAAILDKALETIPESRLQKLREKWLPVDHIDELVEINLTDAERAWIEQNPEIRLGIDPEFAPFEFMDKGEYQGIASDYIRLLNQRLGLNMTLVPDLTWSEVIEKAKKREIDVLPAVGVTVERQRYLSYTDEYLSFHRVIVMRNKASFIAGLSDLEDYSIGVQQNSSHHGYLLENTVVQPVLYPSLKKSLMAVSGGEVDAMVGNVAAITYWIRKLNLTNLKIAAPISTEVNSLHFAVRKDWPELTSILQKGLDSIGPRQRKKISEKWLTLKYEPQMDYTLLALIVGLFSVVVMIVLTWNITLKRKVRQRTTELNYTSNYDLLTGLPNRFLVLDRLKQQLNLASNGSDKVAIISIDIDDFKRINEVYGYQTGDEVLKTYAGRLQSALDTNHTLGRIGGNQFLVVYSQFTDDSDIAFLAEQLVGLSEEPLAIKNLNIALSISMGIALYPDDSDSADSLLKYADSASRYIKKDQQSRYAFFAGKIDQEISRKLELERYIHSALENNELEVFYQPKLDARNRKIVSFEALLRWNNPVLGAVSPAEFIPLVEKNGLILPIGRFVLEQSLTALARWHQRYGVDFIMAVYLSPVQFLNDELIPLIKHLIAGKSLPPHLIEFEITEGVLLSDTESVKEKLRQIEEMGSLLAMDDFGTGYSSMSYLRTYKFDTIKIDREFITDLPTEASDRKLVAATIAMAHELGMIVVAEGVETAEQEQILMDCQCDLLQGWLYSKAESFSDISAMLDRDYLVQDKTSG